MHWSIIIIPRINRERIRANWDDMHRVAASLQDGTVTAQLLVSKLQALKQQSGAHKGIQELGRLFKTLAALTYISDEGYRRRIHHTLNKGELLHALAREIFFGQQGLFRERDYLAQLNRATCMSLIINAIVVWAKPISSELRFACKGEPPYAERGDE